MLNWYDLIDDYCNSEYLEKLAIDNEADITVSKPYNKREKRTSSWVRKRNYKNKLRRRFLSINPAMNITNKRGITGSPGIYLCFPKYNNGVFYDPRISYCFNPYYKIYLSRRGDLRKCYGNVFPVRGSYAIGNKDKTVAKITNRRIRQHCVDEDTSYSFSYCKKYLGPLIDEIW